MLKIEFDADTKNDQVTPINIASALIQRINDFSDDALEDINEISHHLEVYVRAQRTKEHRNTLISRGDAYHG